MIAARWILGAALFGLVACKSTGVNKVEDTVASMRSLKDGLNVGSQRIDEVVTTLTTLSAAKGDMKAQYNAYSKAVAGVKKQEAYLKELRSELTVRKSIYLDGWNADMAKLSNPDLRKRAEERRAKVTKTFDELNETADEIRKEYDPWIGHATDVMVFLENDLNAGGIAAVSKDIKSVQKDAGSIKEELGDLAKRLDEIIGNIEAAKAEVPK